MALNPIRTGLRNVHHNSNTVARFDIVIAADDVLAVTDDIARQLLLASRQFVEVTDEQAADIEARKAAAAAEDEPVEKPKAKRTPKPKADG